ncbi:lipoprotein [Enterobacter sp. R1(2018)]|uniref:lipoprotein n=1 Tax=Enterobacter sp. R1(2018) TaxID=2447891 RepID=UPI000EB2E204|nr:lipoprotein [Enterobacter sp. R1(2018)]RKQ39665.1 lipoprotein [Enterobacter sp. R1(2018)]
MRSSVLALLPCAMLLTACTTTVNPAFKDIGTRSGPCVDGGPDSVAQQFYDYRIAHKAPGASGLTGLRPYLSDALAQQLQKASASPNAQNAFMRADIFSSNADGADSAEVASASTIPNTDARNIPLRVRLTKGSQSWLDEVLMVREGQCWAVDDIRYLGNNSHTPSGSLRQAIETN